MTRVPLRIREAPVFRRLTEAALCDLSQECSLRNFARKEVLLREGGLPVEVFLLLSGRVSVVRRDSGGRNRVLALRHAGAWIGEMGVVCGTTHSATVVAETLTRVLVVPTDAFTGVILTSDSATCDLLEIIASRLNESDQDRVGHVERSDEADRLSDGRETPSSSDRVSLTESRSFQEATRLFQAQLIRRTLDEVNGNVSEAARRLRIARSYLYKLIESFDVPREQRLDPADVLPRASLEPRSER